MAVAWFLVPYTTTVGGVGYATRVLDIDQFSAQITAAGGNWTEIEVLGNHALVKVRRVPQGALDDLAAVYSRLPQIPLSTTLSGLTAAQKTALRDRIEALGYTRQELEATLGTELGQVTLRQVLRFIARRRRTPRWDVPTQTVMLDGAEVAPPDPDTLDQQFPD